MKPDRETLRRMYWDECMTQAEIAEVYGKSDSTIGNWFRDYGIETRDVRAAQRAVTPDRDTLYRLYVVERIPANKIAQRIPGIDEARVLLLLERYGIERRDRAAHLGGWNKGRPLPESSKRRLSELAKQRTGNKSPRFGAKLEADTKAKISSALVGRFRGEENPRYKPDAAHKFRVVLSARFEYKEWRKSVYARDNYTCQMCGKPGRGDLQCHHIKTLQHYPELATDVANGITLCVGCHRSIKGREEDYEAMFTGMLAIHPR